MDGTFESLSIFPGKLDEWAREFDIDTSLFYREMKARNLIITDKDTNQTKTKSEKTGRNERVIKLIMPKYPEEKEEGKIERVAVVLICTDNYQEAEAH